MARWTIISANPHKLRVVRKNNEPEDERFNWAKAWDTISEYTRMNAQGNQEHIINHNRLMKKFNWE